MGKGVGVVGHVDASALHQLATAEVLYPASLVEGYGSLDAKPFQ
jgi:hypothetical protein